MKEREREKERESRVEEAYDEKLRVTEKVQSEPDKKKKEK